MPSKNSAEYRQIKSELEQILKQRKASEEENEPAILESALEKNAKDSVIARDPVADYLIGFVGGMITPAEILYYLPTAYRKFQEARIKTVDGYHGTPEEEKYFTNGALAGTATMGVAIVALTTAAYVLCPVALLLPAATNAYSLFYEAVRKKVKSRNKVYF